jgi:pSer/pThr/pTyr-binding forkhead associated (FHA) protein
VAKLVFVDQGEEQEYVLDATRSSSTIGRNPMCDLRINNPSISRKHAEIRLDASVGTYSIYDLNSSNGTYVNGKRESSASLAHRDELLIGEFKVRFFDSQLSERSITPPAPHEEVKSEDRVFIAQTGVIDSVAPFESTASRIGDETSLADVEQLQAELDSVRTSLENESKRAAAATEEAEQLRAEIDGLTQTNAAFKDALEDLSSELQSLLQANASLLQAASAE